MAQVSIEIVHEKGYNDLRKFSLDELKDARELAIELINMLNYVIGKRVSDIEAGRS